MDAYRAALKRALPKRLDLGPRLFASGGALMSYVNKVVRAAPQSAREWLKDSGPISDDLLADRLIADARLSPLAIEAVFSVEVECTPVRFRSEDPNFCSGHRATARVPFSGSAVLWHVPLAPGFDVALNGKVGRSMRVKDVLSGLEQATELEEYVNGQLEKVCELLHRHDPMIEAYNETLDRDLRTWVSGHAELLARVRSELEGKERRRAT